MFKEAKKFLRFSSLFGVLFLFSFSFVFADDFVPEDGEIVQTSADNFILNSDDSPGDIDLQFGSTLAEVLRWDSVESQFLLSDDLSLDGNQLVNFRAENLATAPTCDATQVGRIYYDTTDAFTYVCDGTSFNPLENVLGNTVQFPAAQARRTTTYTLTETFTDITLDTTDIENNTDIIEHDNVNTDRILIKETGLYQILYSFTAGATATSTHEAYGRVRVNDSTILPESLSYNKNYQGEYSTTSSTFIAELTDGDFVSLQLSRDATADDTQGDISFSVVKLEGLKGDKGEKGDPGSVGLGTDETSFTLDQDNTSVGVDVEIIANQGTDNNGTIRYNSTDNNWEISNNGDPFFALSPGDGEDDIFYAYDSNGLTSLATTPVDITFDTEIREDTEYTHAPDSAEITINTSGNYSIYYECTSEVTTDDRSTIFHWIEADTGTGFTELPGTRAASYHRTTVDGTDTASINHYQSFSAGDSIKVRAQGDSNGNLQTIPNGCRIKIQRLDTGNGLIGPQGPQGPTGPAGTNGLSGGGWGDDGTTTTTALNAQIDGDLNVDGDIGSECGPYGIFWAERGAIASNQSWAMGNGQTPYGTPMGCDGRVNKIAATCTGAIGTSLTAVLRKNNVATGCSVNLSTTVGQATISNCSETFVSTDVLGIYAGTESGSWTECVGTFWVKYD